MKTMSDTYSNKLGEAIESYAEEAYPDCDLYLMDGQADVAKQISQAANLIAKQVDVIILNPQDADGSAQVLDLAADANIPVIEINTGTTRTDYVSYIGSDTTGSKMLGRGTRTGIFEICSGSFFRGNFVTVLSRSAHMLRRP